tara:strand:+ start:80 stop:187 length:108 start_codon:yes stop_codon:yes gene_type:complete
MLKIKNKQISGEIKELANLNIIKEKILQIKKKINE